MNKTWKKNVKDLQKQKITSAKLEKLCKDFFTKMEKIGKNDVSYTYNYLLPEAMAKVMPIPYDDATDTPLIGYGFLDNLIKENFKKNVSNLPEKIEHIVENYKKELDQQDYYKLEILKSPSGTGVIKIQNLRNGTSGEITYSLQDYCKKLQVFSHNKELLFNIVKFYSERQGEEKLDVDVTLKDFIGNNNVRNINAIVRGIFFMSDIITK